MYPYITAPVCIAEESTKYAFAEYCEVSKQH